jgi:flagellar biogenesis protein FliO
MEQILSPRGSVLHDSGWLGRAAAWLRRVGAAQTRPEATLRIEARLSLGPKKSLALVHCRGRLLLLAIAGDSIAPLMEMAAGHENKSAKSAPRRRTSEAQR